MIKYNKEVINVLKNSEKEMYEANDSYVDIDHFILSSLKVDSNIKKIMNKNNIDYNSYKNLIKKRNNNEKNKYIFYSLNLKRILDLSYDTASRYSSTEIALEHIFITLLDENIELKILKELNLNLEKFYKDILRSLTDNCTLLLSEIGIDLTELAKNNKLNKVVGRKKEIDEVIEILARKSKNNPILIGEAGVGKTAIVEELATLISNNNVPTFLKNKKIISINVSSIISGTKYRGEFEEKLNKILKECESRDDIILFIDEIHTIVGAGGAEGAIDASNILKPSLARGTIKVIGATTVLEYKKTIATDKALDRRFQKVYVNIPNINETYNILKNIKYEYENFHNVTISDKLLKKLVEWCDKYIFDRNNPDKSIDILDEACAYTNILKDKNNLKIFEDKLNLLSLKKEKALKYNNYKEALKYKEEEQKLRFKINSLAVRKKQVNQKTLMYVISSKCNDNICDIENKKIYEYLKINLNKKIIGQEEKINDIIDRLKLLNTKKDNSPISFLISGNTGVGKSMFAIEFSKLTNKNLIKLNMSEYNDEISINKIIGSPQGYIGYNDNNTAFEDLKIYPNSIILLDEIEKAHPSIINLFSKIIDEGILKNSKNETINFKNAIFIITSNNNSNDSIGYIKYNQNNDDTILNGLIDRINYSVTFNAMNIDNIKKIIELKLKEFNDNYETNVKLSDDDIKEIIYRSLYKKQGARNINNLIKFYTEKSIKLYN